MKWNRPHGSNLAKFCLLPQGKQIYPLCVAVVLTNEMKTFLLYEKRKLKFQCLLRLVWLPPIQLIHILRRTQNLNKNFPNGKQNDAKVFITWCSLHSQTNRFWKQNHSLLCNWKELGLCDFFCTCSPSLSFRVNELQSSFLLQKLLLWRTDFSLSWSFKLRTSTLKLAVEKSPHFTKNGLCSLDLKWKKGKKRGRLLVLTRGFNSNYIGNLFQEIASITNCHVSLAHVFKRKY